MTDDQDDTDARFRDLVETEFGTSWTSPALAPGPVSPPAPNRPSSPASLPPSSLPPVYPPRDTFEFTLFDDDERYRSPVGDGVRGWAMVAVALLFAAVLAAALMIAGVDLPAWARWLGLASLAGGVLVSLWQFRGRDDRDDDGAVV